MQPSIVIRPYDEQWPSEFNRLAALIRPVCPPGSALHHIGSTAVAGLAAKPIIDLQLSVDKLGVVDLKPLRALGFEHVPNMADHCPPAMKLPAVELQKLYLRLPNRTAHLHIRERGRFNQRYALLCRDFLRTSPRAAAAYELVKRELALRFADDPVSYYAIKDPVFDLIMAGAELWAASAQWQEPAADG